MPSIFISAEPTAECRSKVFCPHVAYVPGRGCILYTFI